MGRFLWQDVIKMNITILRLLGLSPKKAKLDKSDPYTYFTIFVMLCSTTHVVFLAMNIRVTHSNLEQLTQTILFCFAEYLAVFKMIAFVTNTKLLKGLLQDLNHESFQPRNVKQVLLISPDIRIWKMIYSTLMTGSGICLVLLCSVPILTGTVKRLVLPSPGWYPYDTKDPVLYAVTYLYQAAGTCFITFGTYNVDMLIAALMMIVGAQCDILCDNLRNLGLLNYNFGKMIKKCITHHNRIVRLAEKCNEFFNIILLVQFFTSSACLALCLFSITLVSQSSFEFYTFLAGVLTFTTQLFAYCWFGNKIHTKSEKISYALFESSWTDQSSEDKLSIIVFAERAQLPIKLSTFKLFYLTLETFVKILRSAVSYYTVLRQINGFK